ncbi:MAG: hypothetical protein COA99_11995 [Moraxellaceae bacterium]|nr:MAG: hypothetical protein COA99_11995 [Moraxellaceae bacterium]
MSDQNVMIQKEEFSQLGPIYGAHIKRIGWIRTNAGGICMYTCVPPLIIAFLSISTLFYQAFVRPIFGTPKMRWADYVVVDRHRIEALTWFDKMNCMFCGFASGMCTMVNKELDHIAEIKPEDIGFVRSLGLTVMLLIILPVTLFMGASYQVIYNVLVATPLGLHRISIREAGQVLKEGGYAESFPAVPKFFLKLNKNIIFRFAMALEQIESSWCPLAHFERREGIVYPDHQKNFFGPDQLHEMHEILATEGSVSDRKPKY